MDAGSRQGVGVLGADDALFPSNPFDDPAVAARYEDWYSGPGQRADALEKSLLKGLLADFPGARTVLEVGCGTGHFTR